MNVTDAEIKQILTDYKKICVMGLSTDATKPSQKVPVFMRSQGYSIVGIYPGQAEINGFPIYQKLSDVPLADREFVDVFRRPEHIPTVVDEVIAVGGVKILWLQLGISHPEAEAKAAAHGIRVISDRCLHIEYEKWLK